MKLKRGTKHYHIRRHDEEYAAEITPHDSVNLLTSKTNKGVILGYIALFISLFSIAFYPVFLGSIGIVAGLIALRYGAKTLAFTAIGFSAFSIVFSLFFRIAM
ncbi:permease [Ectobacillus sp. JY-23]|uniref:permease n=1 Tax=Ectobacillus sp. JY-23 TaxID=2933872 RepID=UPI001FF3331B|nr:permease [Ectobacillus sp. JY-23]UOY92783.1 permease [Ectobacillus sp. JY-23]